MLGIDREDLYMALDRLNAFGLLTPIATRIDKEDIVFYSRADGEDGFFVITRAWDPKGSLVQCPSSPPYQHET